MPTDYLSYPSAAAGDWFIPDRVFTDGGVIGQNPSPVGGTWAFLWRRDGGDRTRLAAGHVTPKELGDGFPLVTNNLTEFLAVLIGLEGLPDGWAGRVCTDSLNAIRWFTRARSKGPTPFVPKTLWDRRCVAVARLGRPEWVLHTGHPTKADLATGRCPKGRPVSEYNVLCDKAATEAGAVYLKTLEDSRGKGPGQGSA